MSGWRGPTGITVTDANFQAVGAAGTVDPSWAPHTEPVLRKVNSGAVNRPLGAWLGNFVCEMGFSVNSPLLPECRVIPQCEAQLPAAGVPGCPSQMPGALLLTIANNSLEDPRTPSDCSL